MKSDEQLKEEYHNSEINIVNYQKQKEAEREKEEQRLYAELHGTKRRPRKSTVCTNYTPKKKRK